MTTELSVLTTSTHKNSPCNYHPEPRHCEVGWPVPSLAAFTTQLYARYQFTVEPTVGGHRETRCVWKLGLSAHTISSRFAAGNNGISPLIEGLLEKQLMSKGYLLRIIQMIKIVITIDRLNNLLQLDNQYTTVSRDREV